MIYPIDGNEETMGLNMLEHPARKKEATLAKTSDQYTIAGPFTLVQGGNGALLFNPIYVKNKEKKDTFCGGLYSGIKRGSLFGRGRD